MQIERIYIILYEVAYYSYSLHKYLSFREGIGHKSPTFYQNLRSLLTLTNNYNETVLSKFSRCKSNAYLKIKLCIVS